MKIPEIAFLVVCSFPQNDIALLELAQELTFGPDVAAICSPDPNNDYAGDVAIVAGWGRLSYGGSQLYFHLYPNM